MCGNSLRVFSRALSSWRALDISCAFALFAMFMPRTLSAQITSPSSPPDISTMLTSLDDYTSRLIPRLIERKQESSELSATLERQQAELTQSEADLTATSSSLTSSEMKRKNLQTDFDNFKSQSALDLAAVEKARDTALTLAKFNGLVIKIAVPVALACVGYEGGRALKIWK